MWAVFSEVNATEAHAEPARKFLNETVAPRNRESGAKGGYFLAPQNGRGIAIVVYESEAAAREAAAQFTVGESPGPGAPEGVTMKTIEVREVLASV